MDFAEYPIKTAQARTTWQEAAKRPNEYWNEALMLWYVNVFCSFTMFACFFRFKTLWVFIEPIAEIY